MPISFISFSFLFLISFIFFKKKKMGNDSIWKCKHKKMSARQEYIEINWVPANVWDKLSRRFINNGTLLIAAHSNRARLLYTENVIGLKRSNVGGWRFRLRVTGIGRHFRPFLLDNNNEGLLKKILKNILWLSEIVG